MSNRTHWTVFIAWLIKYYLIPCRVPCKLTVIQLNLQCTLLVIDLLCVRYAMLEFSGYQPVLHGTTNAPQAFIKYSPKKNEFWYTFGLYYKIRSFCSVLVVGAPRAPKGCETLDNINFCKKLFYSFSKFPHEAAAPLGLLKEKNKITIF